MSSEDQTYQLLSELQLSEYETRAYLSVLEGGIMVARDISDRASIPYAKVYQTLNDLIDKQLITGDEGRPKKFRPRSPKIALIDRLDSLEKQWKEQHRQRTKQIKSILPELQDIYEASEIEEEEEQGVWNILGKTNIRSRITKLSEQTRAKILVITADISGFSESFSKSLKIGDDIKLELLSNKMITDSDFDRVFVNENVGNAITIFFDEFAMMSIAEIQKGRFSAGEYTAVLTQIGELVSSTIQTYGGLMSA